ncbi:AlpA family phage regulatory protein [Caballeronia grimmiae]
MAAKTSKIPPADAQPTTPRVLPLDGFTRWSDLKQFVPLSHESIRQRELKGRFPKRVQLGSARCVAWPNREIHRWLADPAGYRAALPSMANAEAVVC